MATDIIARGMAANANKSVKDVSDRVDILGKIGTIRGRKLTYEDLPETDNKEGDIWLVGEENAADSKEYIWTTEHKWELLGTDITALKTQIDDLKKDTDDKFTAADDKISDLNDGLDKIIVISEDEPTDSRTKLWIKDSNGGETVALPEVKDDEINEDDTWSSSKISTELESINEKLSTKAQIVTEWIDVPEFTINTDNLTHTINIDVTDEFKNITATLLSVELYKIIYVAINSGKENEYEKVLSSNCTIKKSGNAIVGNSYTISGNLNFPYGITKPDNEEKEYETISFEDDSSYPKEKITWWYYKEDGESAKQPYAITFKNGCFRVKVQYYKEG